MFASGARASLTAATCLSRSSQLLRSSIQFTANRESRIFAQSRGVLFSRSNGGRSRFSSSSKQQPGKNDTPTKQSFLQRWMAPKEMPPRNTPRWYAEMLLICTVFAITGTSTMVLVRPAMTNILGLKGSLKDGPWSYRICSLVIMTPLYSMLLVVVGTIFGRHAYFRHFAVKMFSRFGIPPHLMDKNFAQNAKNFRKY